MRLVQGAKLRYIPECLLQVYSLSRSSPNDDSFFVLHAKEYDNIFDCKVLPEALSRLAAVFQLERNSELQLNVDDR